METEWAMRGPIPSHNLTTTTRLGFHLNLMINITGTQVIQQITVYTKHSFVIGITILRYSSTLGTLSQNTAGKQDGLL